LYRYGARRDLHSFPTRRSSDLYDSNGFGGIIISRNREIYFGGIAVGIHHSKGSNTKTFSFCQSDVFMGNVNNKQSSRCTTHLGRSEEHTSELQSRENLVCRLLL